MPFKRRFALASVLVAVVVGSAGTSWAREDPPLDMAVTSVQFEACLTALLRWDIKDGTVEESAEMRTCRDFLQATWDHRPADRSGWSNQIDHQALSADVKGSGVCFRAARLQRDADKANQVTVYFRGIWEALARDYVEGRVQEFTIRAGAFAQEMNAAAMEATQWEDPPDADYWNANCAGNFGTQRDDVVAGRTGGARFGLDGSQQVLTVTGLIEPGFAEQLIQQLDQHPFAQQLALSSVGGTDVEEAMKVGRVIRDRRIRTRAVGNCESACTMLFVAGAGRRVGQESSDTVAFGSVGFHRMSVFGTPIPDDSELYDRVAAYFMAMGARPDMVLDFMTRNAGLEFYYPSLEELCAADIVGVAVPGTGLAGLMGGQSSCEKFRFLDRNKNYHRAPD